MLCAEAPRNAFAALLQADIARSALAFAGLLDFLVPQQVKPAIKAYEAVVPAGLRYTNEQWLHNKDQASPNKPPPSGAPAVCAPRAPEFCAPLRVETCLSALPTR